MKRPSLTTRVKVQRREEAANDGAGNIVSAWADYASERAQIAPYSPGAASTEALQAARLEGRGVVFVTMRANARTRAITPADRLLDLDNGRTFGIIAVDPADVRDSFVRIVCETGRADG